MRLIAAVVLVLLAMTVPAAAVCIRGVTLSAQDAISKEFEYLICLHNEQVRQINALSTAVYSVSGEGDPDLRRDLDALGTTTLQLSISLRELTDRMSRIETRLLMLEAAAAR